MSYSLGAAEEGVGISVGRLAKEDPFVSSASVMAANLMKQLVAVPQMSRATWVRSKLNGLWPGMGDEALLQFRRNVAAGKSHNQSLFDAVRLVLANRLVEWAGTQAARRSGGTSGLGDFARDARTFACTSASVSAQAGGWVGAFRTGADTSVIGGAQAGAAIANCGLETLEAQARIARENANAAASADLARATAASAGAQRTVMYVAAGAGSLLVLAVVAKMLMK